MTYYQSVSPIEGPFHRTMETFNPNLSADDYRWIPKGIMHDLRDTENSNEPFPSSDDLVSGFSFQQLFGALTADVSTPEQYKTKLMILNNNYQLAQVNTLFIRYGY